jgi:hypothetical protein
MGEHGCPVRHHYLAMVADCFVNGLVFGEKMISLATEQIL